MSSRRPVSNKVSSSSSHKKKGKNEAAAKILKHKKSNVPKGRAAITRPETHKVASAVAADNAPNNNLSRVLATVPKNPSPSTIAVAKKVLSNAAMPSKGSPKGALSLHKSEGHHQSRPGVSDLDRGGAAIRGLSHLKNVSPAPVEQKRDNSHQITKLMHMMRPEEVLSPDAQRLCDLLQDPFGAPWGDDGELQVKGLLYDTIVPPSSTSTCRQYGQMYITVPPNGSAWVALCVGAGNIQDVSIDPEADTLEHAAPVAFFSGGTAGKILATPGAPNDARPIAGNNVQGGQGVAGYWYSTTAADISKAPAVDVAGLEVIQALALGSLPGVGFSASNLLQWGSPPPFDEMEPFDSSQYKYRPLAGGLHIIPVDATLSTGGAYNVSIIPQATNEAYAQVPLISSQGNGKSLGSADFFALPDHAVSRADGSCTVAWLPSRMDYSFLQTGGQSPANDTSDATGVFSLYPMENTEVPNARTFVQIVPPFATPESEVSHVYLVTYVAFYEVAGRCIQDQGVVPRPQPSLGAKVATTVQNSLNQELKDRSKQISKGTAFEVVKDHPKIGPMIERVENHEEVKGVFDEILGFAKNIAPIVGTVAALL